MGTKTHLPDGSIERGSAVQRHLARTLEATDGVHVVVSYSMGDITVSAGSVEAVARVLELADEYDCTVSGDLPDKGHIYPGTGRVSLLLEL